MKNRLQQFWNFGHNCGVIKATLTQAEDILNDNRFTAWAITPEEKEQFMQGFYRLPRLWTRTALRPIDIRPIIRTPLEHTHDVELSSRQRNGRNRTVKHTPETIIKLRNRAQGYWQSSKGHAMKEKLRQDRHREHLTARKSS